jgi:hypothetical protein
MAVNTAVTAETGAAALGSKIVIYQRTINFATNNLDTGDWFDLFQMPAGAIVLGGMVEIVTAGTATTDITIGVEDGTELCTGANLDGTAGTCTAFTSTNVVFDGTTIDLSCDTANAVAGAVRVTAIVAYCDAM